MFIPLRPASRVPDPSRREYSRALSVVVEALRHRP
jgi:hypothetical protein